MKTFGEIVVNLWNNLNKEKVSHNSKYSQTELKQAFDFNQKFHDSWHAHEDVNSIRKAAFILFEVGHDAPPIPLKIFFDLDKYVEEEIAIAGNTDTKADTE